MATRPRAHAARPERLPAAGRADPRRLLLRRLLQLTQAARGGRPPPARGDAGLPAQDSILGGIDEAIAVLKHCSEDWDALEVHALHEGDEISPWETVMTIEGDYSLFAHLETVYLGCLARRTLIMRNVREVVEAAARQADPVLPRPPRPLAGADRRRLGGARRRRDRRLDRRAGLVVGRPRRRHGAARADRRLRRRHGRGGARVRRPLRAAR